MRVHHVLTPGSDHPPDRGRRPGPDAPELEEADGQE